MKQGKHFCAAQDCKDCTNAMKNWKNRNWEDAMKELSTNSSGMQLLSSFLAKYGLQLKDVLGCLNFKNKALKDKLQAALDTASAAVVLPEAESKAEQSSPRPSFAGPSGDPFRTPSRQALPTEPSPPSSQPSSGKKTNAIVHDCMDVDIWDRLNNREDPIICSLFPVGFSPLAGNPILSTEFGSKTGLTRVLVSFKRQKLTPAKTTPSTKAKAKTPTPGMQT